MPIYQIQDVRVENVVKGKNRYSVAHVTYSNGRENKEKKIMSFSNPKVLDEVQKLVGKNVDVQFTQGDQFYSWASVTPVDAEEPKASAPTQAGAKPATTGATPARSPYETPEERKLKQLYIIRQSSVANAIAFLKGYDEQPTTEEVLTTAQAFVNFVYNTDTDLFDQDNDLPE